MIEGVTDELKYFWVFVDGVMGVKRDLYDFASCFLHFAYYGMHKVDRSVKGLQMLCDLHWEVDTTAAPLRIKSP